MSETLKLKDEFDLETGTFSEEIVKAVEDLTLDIPDLIKADPRVEYIAAISGGRHLFDVPLDLIEHHPVLCQIRSEGPKQVDLLKDSLKQTGGTSLYPPSVMATLEEGRLHFYCGDGHQRVRAAIENGDERITVQWIDRWRTAEATMAEAMSANYARYEMNDADVYSVLATGQLTVAEIAKYSGKSESTVGRMAKIAKQSWLRPMIEAKAIGVSVASGLLEAAEEDPQRLKALEAYSTPKFESATKEAAAWAEKIASDKRRKFDKASKDRAKVKTYFKEEDWEACKFAIETDAFAEDDEGHLVLDVKAGTGGTKKDVFLGDAEDWQKEFAVYNFFGAKTDDVLTEDIDVVLKNWENIRQRIESVRDERAGQESSSSQEEPSATSEE